jgi:acyl-CoA synthetase (AMP-forming)/AMP-acid ligase II
VATESADGSAITPINWSASLQSLADQFDASLAVIDGQGQSLRYIHLSERAHRLARLLITRHGVGPGEPVASLLPNMVCAVVASYGIRASGAAEVLISYKNTGEEIQWCMHLSSARYVVTLSERADEIRELGFEPLVVDPQGEFGQAQGFSSMGVLPPVRGDLDGRVLFTSGTTGKPKGVLYSHHRRWVAEQMLKASLPFTPRRHQKLILMTPFIHGSSLLTYAWCDHGAPVILLEGVDQEALSRYLPDPNVVAIFAPPTVLAKLATLFAGQTFPHIRCVFTGTQPLTPALYRTAKSMFGPTVRITYGKSECVNPITVLTPDQTDAYFDEQASPLGACVGYPAPGVDLKIMATEGGDQVLDAADGEVWLRAPHMSLGFLTADGFVPHGPDGWHQTGDLGHVDERGRLILTGRLADVIKTGGYRVNPDEIEACLATLDSSAPLCVTSVPSDYWGEIIIAVSENPAPGWQALAQQAVVGLSRHKQPRAYLSVDALVRNPQGKVSRRLVRQKVLATYQLIDGQYPTFERKG